MPLAFAVCACASSAADRNKDVALVRHVDMVAAPLAGARCQGNISCHCRRPGDDTESSPPTDGTKRLEIRMSSEGGTAVLESPVLGKFQAAGPQETCFYLDVVAGSTNEWAFTVTATQGHVEEGVSPRLGLAEYGPKGPYWYDVLAVSCVGTGGRCDREGADAWIRDAGHRKRGRLDPCGSTVVTGLRWDTSGGLAARDGGLFRDFSVRFSLEVKKFQTQFAPGSPECGPK